MLKYILCCAMYILDLDLLYFSPINDLQNFHSSQLSSTCTNCFYIVFYHHYMAEILPIWPGTLINE